MIFVSDTSAITSLIQIGRERTLQMLFEQVVIPVAVRDHVLDDLEKTGFRVGGTLKANSLRLIGE